MSVFEPDQLKTIQYSSKALRRAERALKCSAIRLNLLREMQFHGVSLREIIYDQGMLEGYTRRPLSEMSADSELMWLIAVGLLRREVDGQGLTDSFRLTPLGRYLIHQYELQGLPDLSPQLQDHIYNALSQWLRLPAWLQ